MTGIAIPNGPEGQFINQVAARQAQAEMEIRSILTGLQCELYKEVLSNNGELNDEDEMRVVAKWAKQASFVFAQECLGVRINPRQQSPGQPT